MKRRRKEDEVARAFKEANAGPDTAELAKQQVRAGVCVGGGVWGGACKYQPN